MSICLANKSKKEWKSKRSKLLRSERCCCFAFPFMFIVYKLILRQNMRFNKISKRNWNTFSLFFFLLLHKTFSDVRDTWTHAVYLQCKRIWNEWKTVSCYSFEFVEWKSSYRFLFIFYFFIFISSLFFCNIFPVLSESLTCLFCNVSVVCFCSIKMNDKMRTNTLKKKNCEFIASFFFLIIFYAVEMEKILKWIFL